VTLDTNANTINHKEGITQTKEETTAKTILCRIKGIIEEIQAKISTGRTKGITEESGTKKVSIVEIIVEAGSILETSNTLIIEEMTHMINTGSLRCVEGIHSKDL